MATGAANATINRELAALKRMLNLGAKQTPPLVDRVPFIPMLKENNTRKGFFEHDEFLALRDALPQYLKGFVTFAYKVGWRISEIANIKWSQVDRAQGIVRLEVGETKNNDGRTVYLDDELKEVIQHQWENRKFAKKLIPYVFTNQKGDNRIKRFDKAWKRACIDSGIGVRLFPRFQADSRPKYGSIRCARKGGNDVSGHKTRSVFDRYNIVNDHDLKLAAKKQAEYLNAQRGHNLGTICRFSPKNGKQGSR